MDAGMGHGLHRRVKEAKMAKCTCKAFKWMQEIGAKCSGERDSVVRVHVY